MTRVLTISACAAAALAELYVLAFYAPARVDSRARHVALVTEFGAGARIRQTIVCAAEGLDRIDVMMHAARATGAVVVWELAALDPNGEAQPAAAAGRRRLTLPTGESWQRFPLSPAGALPPGRYAFTMTLDRGSVAAGSDVAVGNALDNPLRRSYLAVNGVPRWGDLVMTAHMAGDTIAGRFALRVVPRLPRPFNDAVIWFGLVLLLNVLAAATIREMLLSP